MIRPVVAATRTVLAVMVALAWPPLALAADRAAPSPDALFDAAGIPAREPTQVVVFDRQAQTTTVISRDAAFAPGSAPSSRPSVSADGSIVAFQSDASLVTEDTDGATDVYLWDAAFGQVQLVSRRLGGGSNGESRNPAVSGDGSTVAFASTSTNLTDDGGLALNRTQVYTWQRLTGAITLASVATGGGGGAGNSVEPAISTDGRVVGFESTASNLIPGDTNDVRDIFLRDVSRGATIRASVANDGSQVGAESRRPSLSGDGGVVAFDSPAARLVRGDTNGARDVFVRDLPPAVTVFPTELNFGIVSLNQVAILNATVTSYGWTPVAMAGSQVTGTNAGDFAVAGDSCTGLTLPAGATCAISVVFIPVADGPRAATLEILDTATDSPQLVALLGGVPAPEFTLEPAIGPAGMVAVLSGTNLPEGAIVSVAWDRGLTQNLEPFVVGPDRALRIQVLVYHHDVLGPRQLIVTTEPGGPQIIVAPLPFLVVPAPLQPGGDSPLSYLDPELRIQSRR